MLDILKSLPILLSASLFFCVAVGIYRCKNTLETLHFATIGEIICLPFAFLAVLLGLGFSNTRLLFVAMLVIIVSPISSYFLGKLYYERHPAGSSSGDLTNNVPEAHSSNNITVSASQNEKSHNTANLPF